ncbi:MAG: thiosulfate/3-mercaptopyruvate sulfurtransferase [Saprospiraceae bacterium]|jgi:thiosulfate/3-mercaptopyruvate sulfurtransferase
MTYTTLISSAELIANQQSDWVVVDCRFSLADTALGEQQYVQAHIPGSFYAHLDHDLSSPITLHTGRHPLPDFEAFAAKVNEWGVNATAQVIAYDDMGGAFASRLWWLLQACGHSPVAVLNGGLAAWQAVDGELTTELPVMQITSQPYVLVPNTAAWLEVDEVEANLITKDFELIDARTVERYQGDEESIDALAGRIPGALNLPVPDNLESGQFKSTQAIRDNFLQIATEAELADSVHYCGSGVFACHNILSMAYAGLGFSRLYPGSWSEWIRSEERDKVGTCL